MSTLNEKAGALLEKGEVEFVLGHRAGTSVPGRAQPFYARTVEDADKLVFNETCQINLTGLIKLHHRRTKRFAVVLKPCDARGLMALMQERQLERRQVYMIGVTCPGVIDIRALPSLSTNPSDVEEKVFEQRCLACSGEPPGFVDEVVEPSVLTSGGKGKALPPSAEALEKMTIEERLRMWEKHFARCIRCHACRLACPVCACASCIFERTAPAWVDRSVNPSDNQLYSMIRLWHLSGRCTGCGECERVCPAGIPFTAITAHLANDARCMFGTSPGDGAPDSDRVLSSFNDEIDEKLADFIK